MALHTATTSSLLMVPDLVGREENKLYHCSQFHQLSISCSAHRKLVGRKRDVVSLSQRKHVHAPEVHTTAVRSTQQNPAFLLGIYVTRQPYCNTLPSLLHASHIALQIFVILQESLPQVNVQGVPGVHIPAVAHRGKPRTLL